VSGAAFHRGSSHGVHATPWDLIAAVEEKFGKITCDLAASAANKRCDFFIDEDRDTFKVVWHKLGSGLLWLNPPFASIEPWVKKCALEARHGAKIALLVPASVGSEWFTSYVWGRARVLPLRPRPSFDGKNPYPKDVMLCVYGVRKGFEPWRWRP
jgi:phage N-6-adenine-methyltransferase